MPTGKPSYLLYFPAERMTDALLGLAALAVPSGPLQLRMPDGQDLVLPCEDPSGLAEVLPDTAGFAVKTSLRFPCAETLAGLDPTCAASAEHQRGGAGSASDAFHQLGPLLLEVYFLRTAVFMTQLRDVRSSGKFLLEWWCDWRFFASALARAFSVYEAGGRYTSEVLLRLVALDQEPQGLLHESRSICRTLAALLAQHGGIMGCRDLGTDARADCCRSA